MSATELPHQPKIISMEVSSRDDSEYRILIRDQVKYVVIAQNTFDRPTLSMPLDSLSILPWDKEWTIAHVSREPESGDLKTSLSQRNLSGVQHIWGANVIDILTLKRVKQLSGAAFECIIGTSYTSQTSSGNAIAKIARFEWEIPRLERETQIYEILEGTGLAPRFLGHIHEQGRVIGFLLGKVCGREGRVGDIERCRSALRQLHGLGVVHGDVNRYNFIVGEDRVTMVDFERSMMEVDGVVESDMRAEMESLNDELVEDTGRGGGFRLVGESDGDEGD